VISLNESEFWQENDEFVTKAIMFDKIISR
jgi:hypothetical protein